MCQIFKIDVVKEIFPGSSFCKVRVRLFLVMLFFSRCRKSFNNQCSTRVSLMMANKFIPS